MRVFNYRAALLLLILAVALTGPLSNLRAQTAPTDRISTISSLSVASRQPASLYLTTRYGLMRAKPSGMASLVPGLQGGLTSLATHPDDSKRLLASGYSRDGGKLGVMMSADGGENWSKFSEGADGPAAFYALEYSRTDPDVIFGVFEGLQVSRDGGKSWISGGKLPDDVFDLAVSDLNSDTLYTATKSGLFFSRDGGASWQPGHTVRRPATMVHTGPGGRLYAFVLGVGLITAKEPDLTWTTQITDVGDRYFLHMAVDPANPERLYASVDTGAILTSGDGGKSWSSFEGSHTASAERIAKGKQVYEDNCQACHGTDGIGENPDDPNAKDEFGFKAPALNDDAHGWHHSDQNLMNTILTGSSRNERMAAFKETLSGEDVENVVSYVKSLWSFQSLACQGARHMACMGH